MDPQSDLTRRLKAQIDDLPPRLKHVAKYIIDRPSDFALDPVRVTARKTGVSANSLVRLAEKMGFTGFDAFRTPFRQALASDPGTQSGNWLERLEQDTQTSQAQAAMARNEIDIVTRSLRLLSQDRLNRTVTALTRARTAYVTATRGSYALAYYLHYVGRMALPGLELIPRHMGTATDELLDIGPEDCLLAITFSPYSTETIQSMRLARERGATLILLSDSEVIAPRIDPDIVLHVATRSAHGFDCYAGAMAVLDCLVGHLFETGGAAAQDRMTRYQALRDTTGAYWKPPRAPKLRG
ncbi:MurR/RpiR family transcriptional regulator [Fluviibacterium sp. S390]|uniref:MurR/RpiR family transcriptional regulator n=1 Tax=Fluviibacterium sp. S390 TaxID=3415139 RepID=UPI003C79F3AB